MTKLNAHSVAFIALGQISLTACERSVALSSDHILAGRVWIQQKSLSHDPLHMLLNSRNTNLSLKR